MKKEEIGQTLSEIAERTRTMLLTPAEQRIVDYQGIDPLLIGIEAALMHFGNPYATRKLNELKVHLIAVARLDDPDGSTDQEHCKQALEIIEELGGLKGFNVAP